MEGLDLSKPLSSEHQQLLYDLWREHLLLVFRTGYLDPGSQERVIRYLPHDAKAVDEGRFCNAYFQPRIPSNPLVCQPSDMAQMGVQLLASFGLPCSG